MFIGIQDRTNAAMTETEKITINLNVVDLGKIDLLVEEGFYMNRTDFIRTAIRNEIGQYKKKIEETVITRNYVLGVNVLTADGLTQCQREGKMIDVKTVGMTTISNGVTPDLAEQTIARIKVWGRLQMPEDVRERLESLGRIEQ